MSKDKKVRRIFEYENCTRVLGLPSEYWLPSLVLTHIGQVLFWFWCFVLYSQTCIQQSPGKAGDFI